MGKNRLPASPARQDMFVYRYKPASLVATALLLFLLVTAGRATAETAAADSSLAPKETEIHLLAPGTESVRLAHAFIDPDSFEAAVNGQAWEQGRDYRLRSRDGAWIPLRPLGEVGGVAVLVILKYRFRPVPVAPRVDLHRVATSPTETLEPGTAPAMTTAAIPEESVGQLDVRGSKTVQVSSGNRREVTVDQNLRLYISGQLTKDITVTATLTDDNLPVVPEGNTEELQDVDQVLIQLQAPQWEATLGDFVAERSGTLFGNYRRKLEGFSVAATPGRIGADIMAGSPRGIYRTRQLRGQEANQGPYLLGSGDAGDNIFIVAGSEKVTLDGERLTRGTDRDYVVDYVRGAITFTYRRLITAESTIVVEFEQGEGPYARTTAGGGGQVGFTLPVGDGVDGEIGVRLLREKDDPERLRSGELSEEDVAILAEAGDDPLLAVTAGVTEVAPGEGQYRREEVDSRFIYIYDPVSGRYLVDFFHLGPHLGDYGIDSLTVRGDRVFGYRGAGEGSYRIGRPLPLPENHHMISLTSRLGTDERPRLRAEWNLSDLDKNQLSDLDNDDNVGEAWSVVADLGEAGVKLGGLGRFTLRGRHEARDEFFQPFLLTKDRFVYDRWGLGEIARRPGFLEERDVESNVSGGWQLGDARRGLNLSGQWGRLEHGASLTARRLAAAVAWHYFGGEGQSGWERAKSQDSASSLDITREHQRHRLQWRVVLARPSLAYEQDQWQDAGASDGVGGSRLRRWSGGLASLRGHRWSWQVNYTRALADSQRSGDWVLERDSHTGNLGMTTSLFAGVRLVGDVTYRTIVFRDGPDRTNRLAKLDLSGNWNRLGSDWSAIYSVDNSRAEILNRQIVFVGERQGDYNQVGDFVGRDLGDFTVVFSGTDSLVTTTTVKTDLNWRQDFGFLGRKKIWGAWSSLTILSITGQSRTDDVPGLLRLTKERIFDEDDTVFGQVGLKQEVTFLRHLRWLDLRLRYDYDKTMDRQFASNPEDRLRRLFQGSTTWSATDRTSLRLRANRVKDNRLSRGSSFPSQRDYDAVTSGFEGEWTWRPTTGSRLALAGEYIRRNDTLSGIVQREIAARPSLRIRLQQKWSTQAELRWAEVESDEPQGARRPFFFALPGRNVAATLRLDWDPTKYLNVALFYFGRWQGEGGWQHDFRVESTARF